MNSGRWVLVVCCLFLNTVSPAGELYPVTVEKVISGDAMKVSGANGSHLVALYGVLADDIRYSSRNTDAHENVTRRVEGHVVHIRLIRELAGLQYVETILESGEVLNEILLREGIVSLDRALAGNDSFYKNLEEEARQHGRGMWGATPTEEEPSSNAPRQTLTSEEYALLKEVRSIANFDSEYRIWRALSVEQRELIRLFHLQEFLGRQVAHARLMDNRRSAVDNAARQFETNARNIRDRLDSIAHENSLEASRISDAFDDFDLNWNSRMTNAFVDDFNAEVATGQFYSAKISASLANEYAFKTNADLARVNSEAAGISAHHEAVRARHRNALSYLGSQREVIRAAGIRAEGMENAAVQIARSNDRRANEVIARLDVLDSALADEYVPYTLLNPVRRYELSVDNSPIEIEIDSKLWQLNWYLKRYEEEPGFSLRATRSGDRTKYISTNRSPEQAFEVLQGPGRFEVSPTLSPGVVIIVEVCEVDVPGLE